MKNLLAVDFRLIRIQNRPKTSSKQYQLDAMYVPMTLWHGALTYERHEFKLG
jgi:hypothetical protein